jgi:glycerophosphoryl diester phosphodiesterase
MLFSPRPALVGHRGLGKGTVDGVPENTVESIVRAVALGCDWIEIDVGRTGDDVLVVHHNPATDDGRFLVDQTADEVARQGIARLEEVLDAVPVAVNLDLDLKTALEDAPLSAARGTVGLLAPIVRREAERRQLLVSSFDAGALGEIGERAPNVARGLVCWVSFPVRTAVASAAHLGLDAVCAHYRSFRGNEIESQLVVHPAPRVMEIAHQAGLEMFVWCPDVEEAVTLVTAGADAICLNDVPATAPALRRRLSPVA